MPADLREPMGHENEAVYDEQISPLMTQIIAICKQAKLPMLATFEYSPGNFCTTRLSYDGECSELSAAALMIRDGLVALTVRRG